jgi:hypothetical protein
LSVLEQTPLKLIDLSVLNSSHFLTLDIAMQKVECKINPYFNYPEKNGKSLDQQIKINGKKR